MKKSKLYSTKLQQVTAILPLARERMRAVIGGDGVVVITGPDTGDGPGPK